MEFPLSQLGKIHPLTDEFIHDLGVRMRRLEPVKNNTLLLKGDICRDLYLIEKGMLACYETDGKKKYYSWIMIGGDFVTAVDSFNNQVISSETIVAFTASILWAITKEDFDYLTRTYEEFRYIRQILTDKYHVQSRLMDARRKRPPEQFLEYLRDHYPEIVKEAPITALASLMGITRTTLYEILNR
jgi:CRP-like cAMP-binding protein